jgi:RNA polymerase sigma-70 factor, ECF subfamily
MISESQIIQGCKDGKHHAFNLLYQKYATTLMGICFRYAKSKMEAEDILQEGFVKVFKNIKTFEGKGSFEGWLKRIMVNTAINHNKKNKKFMFNEELGLNNKTLAEEVNETDFFVEIEEVITQTELMRMIQLLPEGYRLVFNLFAIEGMMHQEISKMLDISINTSKTQLFKARRMLKEMIAERQFEKINS